MHLLSCIAATFLLLCLACQLSFSKETKDHSDNSSALIPCLHIDVDYCSEAAKCCHLGVDEYGWIAAAVGWSLWFLTLILFCIDKLMRLQPDEPKHLEA
ncbi:transmembrane protein 213 [Sphaerodactylus townsendi]|uniref:transmembrane protein 213 n=1 Tax=Sphaerodactylus townsendi TaxID=933632 RepID=UPI002026460B|nr:transmembrane protein 213 [Sphaerodactylus townsendi]